MSLAQNVYRTIERLRRERTEHEYLQRPDYRRRPAPSLPSRLFVPQRPEPEAYVPSIVTDGYRGQGKESET